MGDTPFLEIEVVYALPEKQSLLVCEVPSRSTIREAIDASGILSQYPDIDLDINKVGVFGRLVKGIDEEAALQSGDRIEIYRPLLIDPKQARKKKAVEQKSAAAEKS